MLGACSGGTQSSSEYGSDARLATRLERIVTDASPGAVIPLWAMTDFEWDSVYVLDAFAPLAERARALEGITVGAGDLKYSYGEGTLLYFVQDSVVVRLIDDYGGDVPASDGPLPNTVEIRQDTNGSGLIMVVP